MGAGRFALTFHVFHVSDLTRELIFYVYESIFNDFFYLFIFFF